MNKGDKLVLQTSLNILNQCFIDLDEFGKEEKDLYEIVVANFNKYSKKMFNILQKEENYIELKKRVENLFQEEKISYNDWSSFQEIIRIIETEDNTKTL